MSKQLGEVIKWLNEDTECYAEDMFGDGILLDGVLALTEILELARRIVGAKDE